VLLMCAGSVRRRVCTHAVGAATLAAIDSPASSTRRLQTNTLQAWQFSAAEARGHGTAGGRGCLLISLGADGRLLIWTAAAGRLENPVMGYELRCHPPGRVASLKGGGFTLVGGTCLSLPSSTMGRGGASNHKPPAAKQAPESAAVAAAAAAPGSAAFVGTEGGALLRCHLPDADEAVLREFAARLGGAAAGAPVAGGGINTSSSERLELKSPVRDSGYEAAAGVLTGVTASPFQVGASGLLAWAGCRV